MPCCTRSRGNTHKRQVYIYNMDNMAIGIYSSNNKSVSTRGKIEKGPTAQRRRGGVAQLTKVGWKYTDTQFLLADSPHPLYIFIFKGSSPLSRLSLGRSVGRSVGRCMCVYD